MRVIIGKERIECESVHEAFSLVAYELHTRRFQRSPWVFAAVETALLMLLR